MLRWDTEWSVSTAADEGRLPRPGLLTAVLIWIYWLVAIVVASVGAVVAATGMRAVSFFQSDDVAQIVALRSWRRSGRSLYFSGANNYALRLPLVRVVMDHTRTGRDQLYVITAVLVAGAAVFLMLAAKVQAGAGLGAISGAFAAAWVVSNPGVADAIGRPTVRNVELGAAALALVGLDRLSRAQTRWPVFALAAVAAGVAIFLWNDPYFTYIVAVPAIGVAALGAALARSLWRLAVAGALVAGALGATVLDQLGKHLGIDPLQAPFHYPKPSESQRARDLLFQQLPHVMGTKPNGALVSSTQAAGNRYVAGLLIVCGVLAAVWCARQWRELPTGTLVASFMIVVPWVAWYASSNMLTDGRSWRYAMMTPFVLPILLVPAARALPHGMRPAFLTAAALIIGVSLWTNIGPAKHAMECGRDRTCVPADVQTMDRQSSELEAWLENEGVTKVFLTYWHSNTTTYLSDDKVHAVPIDCRHGEVVTWRWLTTDARVKAPTPVSHLVLEAGGVLGCGKDQIVKQLGNPARISRYSNYELWEYPGDIAERLPTQLG